MTPLTQNPHFLTGAGTLVEPRGNHPFLVDDPLDAWIVQTGKIDLFITRLEDGKPVGARTSFMRIGAGCLFCGLDLSRRPSSLAVVAAALPGTVLSRIKQQKLRVLGETEEGAQTIERLIDEWISGLSKALTEQVPPRTYVPLRVGEKITVSKEARPILPVEGIVWVRHLSGSSRFEGLTELPVITGPDYFPVASPAWLEPEPQSTIEVASTRDYLSSDPEWQIVARFHQIASQCLALNHSSGLTKERERLAKQSHNDSAVLSNSLYRLSAIFREGRAGDDFSVEDTAFPLLGACRAIGAAAGIHFRAHPNLRSGGAQKDPVSDIAKASSVRYRRVVLAGEWWKDDAGPLLTFRDSNRRPVALLPGSGRYQVFDPVDGSRVRATAANASDLGPYAYSFYRPFEQRKIAGSDLISFGLHGRKEDLVLIAVLGIGSGLLAMITPILTGIMFDTIIPGAERLELLQMTVFLIGSAFATAMFQLTRSFAMLRLEGQMDSSLQAAVWDRLLSLPVPFFRDFTSGDLALRSLGISQMRQVLTGSVLSSVLSGVFSIFSFALLFYYSWRLALMATVLVAVAFVVSTYAGYRQVRHQRAVSVVRGRISGMILQFITGISKFRVAGAEGRAFASWAGAFSRQKDYAQKARGVSNNLLVFTTVFPILCSGVIFYYVAYLMKQPLIDPLTTGDFLAFNSAFGQFLTGILAVSTALVSVLSVVPLYERAKPILQALPEVNESAADPGELSGAIEVSHLAFQYRPDTPLVLRDINIRVPAGQFVAIVGSSGCGKSTLFRILLGFEKPLSGGIFYDGQDLATLDVQAVRRQIGVVLQSAKLLSGDIFTNIVGSAPLTIDDAWEAARMAGFDQDVKQMPMGMHTVISEGGGGLSGGQQQRLMIARAIVGKPRILYFDEATSALDNRTQMIVSESLGVLKATRVVIAHRLTTIMNADHIYVLDKGLIAQSGSYAELINQPGLFSDLAKRQLL